MKTVVIIQARMGSTRLPGKVMRMLRGTTVLGWVIQRVKASASVDAVVVATTDLAEDEVIVGEAQKHGAEVFRGSSDNVLSRYCGAAEAFAADVIVRVTSDCPLYDPVLLTAMLERFHSYSGAIDYLSSGHGRRTWPRGLDTEIFTRQTLDRVCLKASKDYEREHVTPYIYQHPQEFRLAGYHAEIDHSQHRWTLDTKEDWQLIEAVYNALCDGERIFTTADVHAFLGAHPEVAALNAHVQQKKLGEE